MGIGVVIEQRADLSLCVPFSITPEFLLHEEYRFVLESECFDNANLERDNYSTLPLFHRFVVFSKTIDENIC